MVMDTDKIAEALSKAGLTMNADGSVTNPNDPSAPLPSSIAMNGAEDGQGRFYTDTEFDKELEAIDKLVGSPAGDEKKPFAEKYEAREQLETLRKNIETKRVLTMVDKDTHDQTLLDNARMQVARIEYRFGKIALDCEEGSVRALDHLVNCAMSQLVGQEFADNVAKMAAVKSDDKIVELVTFPKPQAAIAFPGVLAEQVDLLNTTGAANATRENFPLSIALLNIAFDLLKDHADMTKQLEELHTQTTFFLAQVHGANGDGGNSALYCAKTTLRQISFYLTLQQAGGVDVAKSQLDVVDWVKNVLTLAGYYNQVDLNVQADHCFAAVQAVVKLYLAAEGVDEELAYDLRELKTNVEKKRIEFYMNLMNMASTVLQYKMAGVVMPPVPPGGGEEIEVWYADKLPGIEKKPAFVLSTAEFQTQCVSYEFVRGIFVAANPLISSVLDACPLEGHVSSFIEVSLWRANLYKYVSMFESDEKRKQAMLLKRVQAVEGILQSGVNEQAYLGLMKTVYHEVGCGYMDMFDVKNERVEGKFKSNPAYVMKQIEASKCNEFSGKAIANFSSFIRLYFNPDKMAEVENGGKVAGGDGWMTMNLTPDKDEIVAWVNSHFKIARLLSKAMVEQKEGRGAEWVVECMERSLKRFLYFVDYVEKNMVAKGEEMKEEVKKITEMIEIAKQMVELLPLKIKQFKKGGRFFGSA